jgi:hypothetical protein
MHWVVLLTPMPNKPIAIVAILTIYHNLQYHRLIWFHNQKYTSNGSARGSGPTRGPQTGSPGGVGAVREGVPDRTTPRETFGAAELISRRLLYYIAFGILFGLIYQGPRQYLGYLSLKHGQNVGAANEQSLPIQLGFSFLWGYAFIHYYLDSKIWRVRRDPAVGKALNMS